MIADLFEDRHDFRVLRVCEYDTRFKTDNFFMLRSKILACEEMYPSIKTWVDNKVIHGLKTGERVGYIGLLGEKPVVSAIVKKGQNSKFCHLKIDAELRDNSLGDIFFALMTLEVRNIATSIHFTLPESLWESKRKFFESFSFDNVVMCSQQYRLFEEELRSEAQYKSVYQDVLGKLARFSGIVSIAGFSMDSKLVLSVHPKHAEQIMLGNKRIEIRRKFSKGWEGARFNIYASAPTKSLMGEARIDRVIESAPTRIWEHFGDFIGCAKEEFDEYTQGTETVFALVLNEVKPYSNPIPLAQIEHLIGSNLIAPQSYGVVEKSTSWMKAISVAAILQGHTLKRRTAVSQVA